jgi:hypothetical protein
MQYHRARRKWPAREFFKHLIQQHVARLKRRRDFDRFEQTTDRFRRKVAPGIGGDTAPCMMVTARIDSFSNSARMTFELTPAFVAP